MGAVVVAFAEGRTLSTGLAAWRVRPGYYNGHMEKGLLYGCLFLRWGLCVVVIGMWSQRGLEFYFVFCSVSSSSLL